MFIMKLIAVLLLVLPATTTVVVSAFSSTPSSRAFIVSSKRTIRPPPVLFATVYYPDDDGNMQGSHVDSSIGTTSTYFPPDEESYWANQNFPPVPSYSAFEELEALEASILVEKSSDTTAPLARLVAATSHADISKIQDLHVVGMDRNHMDVAATVCEQDSCVSLAVPLAFPHPCPDGIPVDTTAFEQCILQNIQELDELNNQQPALQRTDNNNVELPTWWVHPEEQQLTNNECDSLMQILNEEDFQADIHNLAAAEVGYGNIVQQAAVVAVGPAGLVIRATVLHNDGDHQLETVEIPIHFTQTAQNMEQLRSAVLTTMEKQQSNLR